MLSADSWDRARFVTLGVGAECLTRTALGRRQRAKPGAPCNRDDRARFSALGRTPPIGATVWQHQNRQAPISTGDARQWKPRLTCTIVDVRLPHIIVGRVSGGGSVGLNPTGGALLASRHHGSTLRWHSPIGLCHLFRPGRYPWPCGQAHPKHPKHWALHVTFLL